jgi:hypothetical protein
MSVPGHLWGNQSCLILAVCSRLSIVAGEATEPGRSRQASPLISVCSPPKSEQASSIAARSSPGRLPHLREIGESHVGAGDETDHGLLGREPQVRWRSVVASAASRQRHRGRDPATE